MPSRFWLALCLAALLSPAAHADGLSDLRNALQHLPGQTPLKASVSARTVMSKAEDKAAKAEPGLASVVMEDGPQGLRLAYAPELLQKLKTEAGLKQKDSKAPTPTRSAVNALDPIGLRNLSAAAQPLLQRLETARLKAEKADTWNGNPARLLSFELQFPAGEKYVKSHTGTLDLWVDADGRPLASRSQESVEGRAMMVISFSIHHSTEAVYAVHGDRLVAIRSQTRDSMSGAGESGDSDTTLTLQLPS